MMHLISVYFQSQEQTLSLYLLAFCRIVVGLVFGWASGNKGRDMARFRQTIRQFNLLPPHFSGLAAILFLGGEGTVVACMLVGDWALLLGFTLAASLLFLFILTLVSVLARNIQTTCTCFGSSEKQVSSLDVWRDVGLLLCALAGCLTLIWTPGAHLVLNLLEWVLTGLGAVVFVMLWLHLEEIVNLFREK